MGRDNGKENLAQFEQMVAREGLYDRGRVATIPKQLPSQSFTMTLAQPQESASPVATYQAAQPLGDRAATVDPVPNRNVANVAEHRPAIEYLLGNRSVGPTAVRLASS